MTNSSPKEFLASVYLGDRACKSIHIDCWRGRVQLEIDLISRIRSTTGNWSFYSDEDISDGRLVFTGVRSVRLDPSGPIPNDLIHAVGAQSAVSGEGDAVWVFAVSIGSVAADGASTEVHVEIIASDVHIEDPTRPGTIIRD